MFSYPKEDLPLVVVANIAESSINFLPPHHKTTSVLVQERQFKAERSLLWLGASKLVFVSYPVPHLDYLQNHLGYAGTIIAVPKKPTAYLSYDIRREQPLRDQIVAYAGDGRAIRLIPYANTLQFMALVDILRTECGLEVHLPESPAPENLWLYRNIGSKSGFRRQMSDWLPTGSLPAAVICEDKQTAFDAIKGFSAQGKGCIIKPDRGQAGIGMQFYNHKLSDNGHLPGNGHSSTDETIKELLSSPFLAADNITIEEFIPSSQRISPSLEFHLPPDGCGEPTITYLSNQLFSNEVGHFNGVLISRALADAPWLPRLKEDGITIANNLYEMGYIGHFDLDAVVDDAGQPYLLELNARRTGGTHVHEFALFAFGEDYLDAVMLKSQDAMSSGRVRDVDTLFSRIGDLLYPMQGEPHGVVVTISSTLPMGRFGYILVASGEEELTALQDTLIKRLDE
jgi:hypothetical protein